jgi:hypothetical protein
VGSVFRYFSFQGSFSCPDVFSQIWVQKIMPL